MTTSYVYTYYRKGQAFPQADGYGIESEQDCLVKAHEHALTNKLPTNVFRRPVSRLGQPFAPWKLYTVCYPNGGECKYDAMVERERLAEQWFAATCSHVEGCLHDSCDWSSSFVRFLREEGANLEALGIKLAPSETQEVSKP